MYYTLYVNRPLALGVGRCYDPLGNQMQATNLALEQLLNDGGRAGWSQEAAHTVDMACDSIEAAETEADLANMTWLGYTVLDETRRELRPGDGVRVLFELVEDRLVAIEVEVDQ